MNEIQSHMHPSRLIHIIAIVLLQIGCTSKKITPIQFQARDYEFNQAIRKVLSKSIDVSYGATKYSFVSEHHKLLQTLEINDTVKIPLSDSIWSTMISQYHLTSAKDYIVGKAKDYDIIMINENHYLPKHRHFLKTLLPDLYAQGYRLLALEAIGMLGDGTMYDKDLNDRGYPTIHTGFYTKEPEFSMLIREAISIGYHIIGYDEGSSYGYFGGDREERGAENILRQVDSLNHQSKLIILCGWDHLKEGHSGTYWEYALAERLKQKTKKDILSINQTEYNERLTLGFEKSLLQKLDLEHSSIFVHNKNNNPLDLSKDSTWYDLFVIHPRTKFVEGIPDWVLSEGSTWQFDLSKLLMEPPYKIFVFENKDAVEKASPIYVMESAIKESQIKVPTRGKSIKLVVKNHKESVLIE